MSDVLGFIPRSGMAVGTPYLQLSSFNTGVPNIPLPAGDTYFPGNVHTANPLLPNHSTNTYDARGWAGIFVSMDITTVTTQCLFIALQWMDSADLSTPININTENWVMGKATSTGVYATFPVAAPYFRVHVFNPGPTTLVAELDVRPVSTKDPIPLNDNNALTVQNQPVGPFATFTTQVSPSTLCTATITAYTNGQVWDADLTYLDVNGAEVAPIWQWSSGIQNYTGAAVGYTVNDRITLLAQPTIFRYQSGQGFTNVIYAGISIDP